jgi:hypothetical protein
MYPRQAGTELANGGLAVIHYDQFGMSVTLPLKTAKRLAQKVGAIARGENAGNEIFHLHFKLYVYALCQCNAGLAIRQWKKFWRRISLNTRTWPLGKYLKTHENCRG